MPRSSDGTQYYSTSYSCSLPISTNPRIYYPGDEVHIWVESVLPYTTITMKIFRNGELWKEKTMISYDTWANDEIKETL